MKRPNSGCWSQSKPSTALLCDPTCFAPTSVCELNWTRYPFREQDLGPQHTIDAGRQKGTQPEAEHKPGALLCKVRMKDLDPKSATQLHTILWFLCSNLIQFASQLQTPVLVSQMEASKSTGITIAEEHCACRRCVANTSRTMPLTKEHLVETMSAVII